MAENPEENGNQSFRRGGWMVLTVLFGMVVRAKGEGATEEPLKPALMLQRKAQWRIDFVAAENFMGFHAPQGAARILDEAADFARQGQIAALRWNTPAS
mgnify:CR=1 FL=1